VQGWSGKAKNRLMLTLAASALAFALVYALVTHWAPSRSRYPVQGVDVSQKQGRINWAAVSSDEINFAYLQATEGADFHDTTFQKNWEGTEKNHIRHGAYHVFTLCRLARDQASNFIAHVPRDAAALPAALQLRLQGNCDDRPDRAVVLKEIATFVQMAEAHTGQAIILYLAADFDNYYDVSSAINRKLWLRSMAVPPSFGARGWALWQASALRRVAGIEGPVNWNVVRP
jgi:lysozyme